MGDIHGEHEKLIECLEGVKFDYEKDTLIQLGDIVDRGPKSFEVVEELLKIDNLISIKGNHDDCFLNGLLGHEYALFNQGCKETINSYIENCSAKRYFNVKMSGISTDFSMIDLPEGHQNFFKNQLPYYIDKDNNCFVHGGFNRHHLIKHQPDLTSLWWDRDLFLAALSYGQIEPGDEEKYPNRGKFKTKDNFKEIFIGHTATINWNTDKPIHAANIWNLDTGSGYQKGKLTIMNLETKEIFQSK